MSPQEQWELLKDFGPVGGLVTAFLAALNLLVLTWGKNEQRDTQQKWNEAHETSLRECQAAHRSEMAAMQLRMEQRFAELREYEDKQRHRLRGNLQTALNSLHKEIVEIRKENADCAKDRRDFAVLLAPLLQHSGSHSDS